MKALYGDRNVYKCAFVQSDLTELPFFASKIKLERKRVEAVISADLQNPTDFYESKALQALKPGAEGQHRKGYSFAQKQEGAPTSV
ncbi:hypothetical protein QJS10_CPA09g01512 [Acorus calamus]|uniref:Uncharacterized protein n=1 Tax=Acorus calamus TaxID=4465 RepID=A0AAV9E5C0_ACOCL|nr:hypothetical protein QJS10_CPA09g01512 [Acorus calamus]